MNFKNHLFILIISILFTIPINAQINEDKTGAWYMYFWTTQLKESRIGFQGDIQYRNWNLMGDLEQLLLRGGITYSPENANIRLTAGYAHITSGTYGDSGVTTTESRVYQEALLPHRLSDRFQFTHRFRYEQRWVENQDFRTRFRYNLFLNIPLNQTTLNKNAVYIAFYNEIFINGEREIGNNRRVEIFDRNRFYAGIGYGLTDKLRLQAGYMQQSTDLWSKGQLQLSLHHTW